MVSKYSLTYVLLLTMLVNAALMPAAARANDHAKLVESIRTAVKNPTRDHELYELVIQPEFAQTARAF
ncbi:MAG: hypothetical protein JWL77_5211 [Chthonomonadaceae bacterium]|nr:hypothetical protein [Chthonomonadaceae bacterium]